MLQELVDVAHFDESGAFLERTPSQSPYAAGLSGSSSNSVLPTSGSSSGDGPPVITSTAVVATTQTPSFEALLAVPRDFMACHATHSATEATLLLDVAGLAIEMDAVVACTLEQLQDRAQLIRSLAAAEADTGSAVASLSTTLLVLLSQASMENSQTVATLVQRLQTCVDQLARLRYPLAQCIESNVLSARELAPFNASRSQSRQILADVEVALLDRIDALLCPDPSFRMTPLELPHWQPATEPATPQACWPVGPSILALQKSPSTRPLDDVRLSSSASSASPAPSSTSSSLSAPVVLSSTTQSVSFQLSMTPIGRRTPLDAQETQGDSGSSTTTNGSSNQNGNSSSGNSSDRQHSQPRL